MIKKYKHGELCASCVNEDEVDFCYYNPDENNWDSYTHIEPIINDPKTSYYDTTKYVSRIECKSLKAAKRLVKKFVHKNKTGMQLHFELVFSGFRKGKYVTKLYHFDPCGNLNFDTIYK